MTTIEDDDRPQSLAGAARTQMSGHGATADAAIVDASPNRRRAELHTVVDRMEGRVVDEVRYTVTEAATPTDAVRAAGTPPHLGLHVDHGTDEVAIAIVVDEDTGALRWLTPTIGPETDVRAPGTSTFAIPARVATDPGGAATERGLLGTIGSKLVEIVVMPIVGDALGLGLAALVGRWEASKRPHRIRTYTVDQATGPGDDVAIDRWVDSWGGQRGLLLVHGTYNTAPSSFSGLVENGALARLTDLYGGRVLAFEHPTVAVTPEANARWLAGQLGSHTVDVDIIATSRGGLVARHLAAAGSPVAVRRLVFSATPNAGTALADTSNVGRLVDAVTTGLSLVPDNPITDTAEVVLTILRHIAAGTVDHLAGIAAMHPGAKELGAAPLPDGARFLCSDYEPATGLVDWVKDTAMDLVFQGVANDLVVPTASVYGAAGSGSVDPDHRLDLDSKAAVTHGGFVRHAPAQSRIEGWLAEGP